MENKNVVSLDEIRENRALKQVLRNAVKRMLESGCFSVGDTWEVVQDGIEEFMKTRDRDNNEPA